MLIFGFFNQQVHLGNISTENLCKRMPLNESLENILSFELGKPLVESQINEGELNLSLHEILYYRNSLSDYSDDSGAVVRSPGISHEFV